jgi:fatty acid/phospholipid biosynthesis enzyme
MKSIIHQLKTFCGYITFHKNLLKDGYRKTLFKPLSKVALRMKMNQNQNGKICYRPNTTRSLNTHTLLGLDAAVIRGHVLGVKEPTGVFNI